MIIVYYWMGYSVNLSTNVCVCAHVRKRVFSSDLCFFFSSSYTVSLSVGRGSCTWLCLISSWLHLLVFIVNIDICCTYIQTHFPTHFNWTNKGFLVSPKLKRIWTWSHFIFIIKFARMPLFEAVAVCRTRDCSYLHVSELFVESLCQVRAILHSRNLESLQVTETHTKHYNNKKEQQKHLHASLLHSHIYLSFVEQASHRANDTGSTSPKHLQHPSCFQTINQLLHSNCALCHFKFSLWTSKGQKPLISVHSCLTMFLNSYGTTTRQWYFCPCPTHLQL